MFDPSNITCVRRDDLLSGASSRSPSPALSDSALPDAQNRLAQLLNLDSFLTPTTQEPQQDAQEGNGKEAEDGEEEFSFRLFRAPVAQPSSAINPGVPTSGEDLPQKAEQKVRIRLRSPTPGAGGADEGRFVNPFRGWRYYFTTPGLLSGEMGGSEDSELLSRRKQFEDAAVSGQEMMGWAKVPWPGCDLPWRVIRLKRGETKLPREPEQTTSAITYVVLPEERVPTSRKKPGKKRRIQLRKRAAVAERAKETEAEKRNRKNREKKIKRRQKARDLKAAAAGDAGQAQDTASVATGNQDASSIKDDSE